MAEKPDPIYSQLERALNLLMEGNAKINFLELKLDNKIREIEDEEMARLAQQAIFLEDEIDVSDLNPTSQWLKRKEKIEHLHSGIITCKEKCVDLQSRVKELIDLKDTLFCQSIQDLPTGHVELLPDGTRNERMIMELKMETTECSVCTENVKKSQEIWSCNKCYNIFHLDCATQCMRVAQRNGQWACPYCRQLLNVGTNLKYTCFCGKLSQPKSLISVTPHACGQTCSRGCGILCHPGPCTNSKNSPLPSPTNAYANSRLW